jgi:hypothetical protein
VLACNLPPRVVLRDQQGGATFPSCSRYRPFALRTYRREYSIQHGMFIATPSHMHNICRRTARHHTIPLLPVHTMPLLSLSCSALLHPNSLLHLYSGLTRVVGSVADGTRLLPLLPRDCTTRSCTSRSTGHKTWRRLRRADNVWHITCYWARRRATRAGHVVLWINVSSVLTSMRPKLTQLQCGGPHVILA